MADQPERDAAVYAAWHEFRYPRPATDEPTDAFRRAIRVAMELAAPAAARVLQGTQPQIINDALDALRAYVGTPHTFAASSEAAVTVQGLVELGWIRHPAVPQGTQPPQSYLDALVNAFETAYVSPAGRGWRECLIDAATRTPHPDTAEAEQLRAELAGANTTIRAHEMNNLALGKTNRQIADERDLLLWLHAEKRWQLRSAVQNWMDTEQEYSVLRAHSELQAWLLAEAAWQRDTYRQRGIDQSETMTARVLAAEKERDESAWREADATAHADDLSKLLHSIWLYVDWRYVTRQLTTAEKDLWADAVDRHGSEDEPIEVDRWWRADNRTAEHAHTEQETGQQP